MSQVNFKKKIEDVQRSLVEQGFDGWLLYDFRRTNDLACAFLEIPVEKFLTRRFFYWIPVKGDPIKIVNAIEEQHLDHLPGHKLVYSSWEQFERHVAAILNSSKKIAMEYSPRNAIPYLSKVDGGTIDLVRACGVEVFSSGDLLQKYTSVWSEKQFQSHLFAADVLDTAVALSWKRIAQFLKEGKVISEYDVQQFILDYFAQHGCMTEGDPICAVNAHSADPHYMPMKSSSSQIKRGDFILIDLWCRKEEAGAVYADITRVGVTAEEPTQKQKEIFAIVKRAQSTATELVRKRFAAKQLLRGWEVDEACRQVIVEAGYGKFFIHRTGHSIGEKDHGNGANIDNLETKDLRVLIPGTCFSIEPGIYLPGEFGVRLEYDVFIHHDGTVQVTGGEQKDIESLG